MVAHVENTIITAGINNQYVIALATSESNRWKHCKTELLWNCVEIIYAFLELYKNIEIILRISMTNILTSHIMNNRCDIF